MKITTRPLNLFFENCCSSLSRKKYLALVFVSSKVFFNLFVLFVLLRCSKKKELQNTENEQDVKFIERDFYFSPLVTFIDKTIGRELAEL